jgi:hypothetical protein
VTRHRDPRRETGQIHIDGSERGRLANRILALFSISFVFALTTTACAPLPCPAGYADPNWCHDEFIGGGG